MSRPAYSSKANELSPYILIQPYRCSLTIGKDIIKSLGYPKHVCLRINETNRSFAIIPCEANDVMSFKIPEKLFTDSKCVFRINSKSFLISLVLKYNLDPTCVYSCKGVYCKKLNAVIVSLDESNLDLYNIIEPQGQIKND